MITLILTQGSCCVARERLAMGGQLHHVRGGWDGRRRARRQVRRGLPIQLRRAVGRKRDHIGVDAVAGGFLHDVILAQPGTPCRLCHHGDVT